MLLRVPQIKRASQLARFEGFGQFALWDIQDSGDVRRSHALRWIKVVPDPALPVAVRLLMLGHFEWTRRNFIVGWHVSPFVGVARTWAIK